MSKTGRQFIKTKDGRRFVVEPIMPNSTYSGKGWGDIDPASGKVTGGYGNKYKGAITEDESIITEENGFKNIEVFKGSIDSYLESLK